MVEKKFVPISLFPKRARRFTHGGLVALFLFIYFCVTRTSHDFGETRSYSTQVTADVGEKFPRKIWQIWKVNPLEFDERDIEVARSWTAKNPGYRYEVLTDQNDLEYVETNFGPLGENRPDIVETYRSLTAPIIKADLLRYLVMYIEGGVYADIDVEALRPVERFVPSTHDERDIGMVIGVEIDEPQFSDHPILGPKSQSFCQWTFMCKPRQPVMMRLVENILHWLNELSIKQGKPISELQLDFDDVITGTGPSAFTGAILSEMSRITGKTVTWQTFHDIPESKVVGGFLVLTVEAFAAGQGHSDSGTHNSRNALVKHHYHASEWPKRHPRFYHPIFGEVEKCNWNVDCVKKWDEETTAFAALPQEEQERQIATFRAIGEALKQMEPPPQPILLEKGADINTQGGEYGNALQAAAYEVHERIVQILLEKGADVNNQDGEYGKALLVASFRGHDIITQILLEKGADVNAQHEELGNALHAASDKIVQILLENGADVNAQGG